jgi:predicted DNA-binding protein with PD1-like motif
MIIRKLNNNNFQIRLAKGEKVMKSLHEFAKQHDHLIGFAGIRMIGSVENIEYAFSLGYGQENDGYKIMEYKNKAELLTALGDISWDSEDINKPIIHCHAVFAKNDGMGAAFGGHLKEATANLTVLIIIDILSNKKVVCKLDKEIKMKL